MTRRNLIFLRSAHFNWEAELDLRQGIAFRGSTHILKASTRRFPFLAVIERVSLKVFAAAGLETPDATLGADGELLLVERFDIRSQGRCVGFEEAAALLGETAASILSTRRRAA